MLHRFWTGSIIDEDGMLWTPLKDMCKAIKIDCIEDVDNACCSITGFVFRDKSLPIDVINDIDTVIILIIN